MLSTAAMIKTGKVYENLMINLSPSNKKLRQRMIGIVTELLACAPDKAENMLDACQWNIRAVMEEYQNEV